MVKEAAWLRSGQCLRAKGHWASLLPPRTRAVLQQYISLALSMMLVFQIAGVIGDAGTLMCLVRQRLSAGA